MTERPGDVSPETPQPTSHEPVRPDPARETEPSAPQGPPISPDARPHTAPDTPEAEPIAPAQASARADREARAVDFISVRDSAQFQGLRSKFRAFAFPMTVAFIVWYFSYVLLSTFAVDLMSTPVLGNLNLGLLWGLAQFATTFLLTFLYVRHANKNLDPITRDMRRDMATQEGKL